MKYDRENRAQIDNDKSRKLAGVLGFGAQQLYFIYRGSTDKRRGYYVLIGLVRNELGSDPLGGAVYVFGSTEWSGRGLCVFQQKPGSSGYHTGWRPPVRWERLFAISTINGPE